MLPLGSVPGVNATRSCAGLRTSWMAEWPWAWENILSLLPSRHLKGTNQYSETMHGHVNEYTYIHNIGKCINTSILPSSLMTLGWLKSFMQAASFRNSSISLWEKQSTEEGKERYHLLVLKCGDDLLVIESSRFIVFTATFSDVPSGCLKFPSTTEPNSPV